MRWSSSLGWLQVQGEVGVCFFWGGMPQILAAPSLGSASTPWRAPEGHLHRAKRSLGGSQKDGDAAPRHGALRGNQDPKKCLGSPQGTTPAPQGRRTARPQGHSTAAPSRYHCPPADVGRG